MEIQMFTCIKTSQLLPSPTCRRKQHYRKRDYTRPKPFIMLSSTPTKNRQSVRAVSPAKPDSPRKEDGLSDVPCYTCRRRHVKCDRILPTCAKCAKKGVACLGYQKPLRWADGVAVRGKLKGKTQPVVDSNAVTIVRNNIQLQPHSVMEEAIHFGIHSLADPVTGTAQNESNFMELLNYHNTYICRERVTFEQTKFISRSIATLTPEAIQRLPKDLLNCILGVAAVHMASRQPENKALERMALETKGKIFQCFNYLLQNPAEQQPDVIICCGLLIFAMDVIDHGMSRWMIHFLGSMQVMSSFGGIENLFNYYPHLQLPLTHVAHFETMWIMLSYKPLTKPKQTSRRAVEMLCDSAQASKKFFNPIPKSMTLLLWDIGACAQGVLGIHAPFSSASMQWRERILLDALALRPEDGADYIRESVHKNLPVDESMVDHWELAGTAWKAALTILTLRYLYFGRADLAPQAHLKRSISPTPSFTSHTSGSGSYFHQGEDPELLFDEPSEIDQDFLSAGLYWHDARSATPSPMPSPRMHAQLPPSSLWETRYQIHDEAFLALTTSFYALYEDLNPASIRYLLLPIIVMGLVSRPNSGERELCFSFFRKFKDYMAKCSWDPNLAQGDCAADRVVGEELELDIPWDKLDSYSHLVQEINPDFDGTGLTLGAPEWNWWDMMRHVDLNLAWPCTSGTAHFERGSDFWSWKLISSVVNDEYFSHWINGPTPSMAGPSNN
ncbi:hypothetical protein P154DRAFT_618624 [Amniculicola lignicola CBS 123094]|uniref:Zn(2)-C6 fungal-type domain-containing protein n=1 Tax=Amniculicola lignicola CBS 123094 TaxID=1392246 RepID=A0A6A5WQU9_9PLEO|nr:hypothetical protein P154DRAFT_618624 [Amniculicola lignicola CBS 123094]